MDRPKKSSHASVWAVAAIAAAVVGTTAGFAANSTPPAHASSPTEWSDSLALLEATQTQKDVLPPSLTAEGSPFEMLRGETSRLVGSDDVADYWAAEDKDGKLCLIAGLHGENQVTASSCTPTAGTFQESGIPLQIDSIDGALRAYLVPDGISEAKGEVSAVTPNLLIGDPYEAWPADVDVQMSDPSSAARSTPTALRLLSFEPADGSWRE